MTLLKQAHLALGAVRETAQRAGAVLCPEHQPRAHVDQQPNTPCRLPLNLLLLTHLLEAFEQEVLQQRTDGFRQGRVRVLGSGRRGGSAAGAKGVNRCSAAARPQHRPTVTCLHA